MNTRADPALGNFSILHPPTIARFGSHRGADCRVGLVAATGPGSTTPHAAGPSLKGAKFPTGEGGSASTGAARSVVERVIELSP
jgi:hypothetical protein